MAIIDMLKWDTTNDLFAWKHPEQNLSTYTQLIVHETQEAILFSKGKLMGKFGPGKHTLSTENLPILRALFGLPFGGKNPFTAEVWFVNRTLSLSIPWTTDSMRYNDPGYGTMVPLRAEGQYGVQVADAERFLLSLVGTVSSFDARALSAYFKGELITKTKSAIIAKMSQDRISILDISGYLSVLSDYLKEAMAQFWETTGFRLTSFYITSVDVDNTSAEGAKILEAMATRSARHIEGYTYQQERSFDTMEQAAQSGGIGISGMGAGIGYGLNTGFGLGNTAPFQPQANSAQGAPLGGAPGLGCAPIGGMNAGPGLAGGSVKVFCAKCGTKTGGAKFCPSCGKGYRPCPQCAADNLDTAIKCVMCSRPLGQFCPYCKAALEVNAKFCPSCGGNLKKSCPKCGTEADGKTKFCGNCGSEL